MQCKSVLIIEDDADIRESVEQVLSMEGYTVYSAGNGKEAMTLLQRIPHPPLILLDLMMPVMNGWEFLQAQRAHPQFAHLPVIIVSALPEGRALVPATGLIQAEGLLRKPLDVDSLLRVVEQYCLPAHVVETMTTSDSESPLDAAV